SWRRGSGGWLTSSRRGRTAAPESWPRRSSTSSSRVSLSRAHGLLGGLDLFLHAAVVSVGRGLVDGGDDVVSLAELLELPETVATGAAVRALLEVQEGQPDAIDRLVIAALGQHAQRVVPRPSA